MSPGHTGGTKGGSKRGHNGKRRGAAAVEEAPGAVAAMAACAGGNGRARPDPEHCPVREVLSRVGDKWSVFAVARLGGGRRRFSELRRSIDGISQRMLTLTLRGLERDGLVKRTVHATVPARVDYELTALGRTLLVPIKALAVWADASRSAILAARQRYDARLARLGERVAELHD